MVVVCYSRLKHKDEDALVPSIGGVDCKQSTESRGLEGTVHHKVGMCCVKLGGQKRVSDPLELGLQTVMSHHVGAGH